MRKINKKGFTLAELLIVVAIIAVLVAISIPIFTAQLKKARLATNQANARAAYASAVALRLDKDNEKAGGTDDDTYLYEIDTATARQVAGPPSGITTGVPIDEWSIDLTVGGIKAGDKVANRWYVNFFKESPADEDIMVEFRGEE